MKLTSFGQREWTVIGGVGFLGVLGCLAAGWWIAAGLILIAAMAGLSFFRDPHRVIPLQRGQIVAPADGRVRAVEHLEHFEPFGGPAICIRIFLSVLNVHINRSPCHGRVTSIQYTPGRHLNALKAESAAENESLLMVLHHPTRGRPVAAVRQISGAIARRIVCAASEGEILNRGQRYGMIKFGSTTELFLPDPDQVQVTVETGRRVYAGHTVVATVRTSAADVQQTQQREPADATSRDG
jgi:phosphatidylserine decarboxylase